MKNLDGTKKYAFRKSERLCSKRVIGVLFGGGSRSFAAYPLRVVFIPTEMKTVEPVSVLISVSKRHFKRAVWRNRVKRQVREAYRLNKHILLDTLMLDRMPKHLAMAFLWLGDEQVSSTVVEAKMRNLLFRISEYYQKEGRTDETFVETAE